MSQCFAAGGKIVGGKERGGIPDDPQLPHRDAAMREHHALGKKPERDAIR